MPAPRPLSSAWKASLDRRARVVARALRLARAHAGVLEPALRSCPRRCGGSSAARAPGSSRPTAAGRRCSTPSAITRRRTIAAPPPRPNRCRASQPTTGERTAAMIAAVMTGMTMIAVSDEQPDHAAEQEQGADHQPRHEAQVAQPRGDGEDTRRAGPSRTPRTSTRRPASRRHPAPEVRVAASWARAERRSRARSRTSSESSESPCSVPPACFGPCPSARASS